MKRLIKALLAVTMIVCLALTVVACNTDPCKDGHEWNDGEVTKAATCTEKRRKRLLSARTATKPKPKISL